MKNGENGGEPTVDPNAKGLVVRGDSVMKLALSLVFFPLIFQRLRLDESPVPVGIQLLGLPSLLPLLDLFKLLPLLFHVLRLHYFGWIDRSGLQFRFCRRVSNLQSFRFCLLSDSRRTTLCVKCSHCRFCRSLYPPAFQRF